MKSIIDIIQNAGVENVKVQALGQCLAAMKQKKEHAEITFCTDKGRASELARAFFTGKAPEYIGLVLWVPAKAWDDSSNTQDDRRRSAGSAQPNGA